MLALQREGNEWGEEDWWVIAMGGRVRVEYGVKNIGFVLPLRG